MQVTQVTVALTVCKSFIDGELIGLVATFTKEVAHAMR